MTMQAAVEWSDYSIHVNAGADLIPIITASEEQLKQQVTEVYRQFLATNILVRVKAIAQEIAIKKPDFIGLQEAELWELVIPNSPKVIYDFIKLLLNELKDRGLYYKIAAKNNNFYAELPDNNGNLVRLLDRDVILMRRGQGLKVINRKEKNYKANLVVDIGGQTYKILRGWSQIDVKSNRHIFRVINTHLEPTDSNIQVEQAKELLDGPAKSKIPLIVTGDLNSNADSSGSPTYEYFMDAGFIDTWRKVRKAPGFTAFQDRDLLNAVSELNRRIDFIMIKNGWQPYKAQQLGKNKDSRTFNGLWTSDHTGVFACLALNQIDH